MPKITGNDDTQKFEKHYVLLKKKHDDFEKQMNESYLKAFIDYILAMYKNGYKVGMYNKKLDIGSWYTETTIQLDSQRISSIRAEISKMGKFKIRRTSRTGGYMIGTKSNYLYFLFLKDI